MPRLSQTGPSRGEQIKQLRIRLGLTKTEAARLAGVSRREWHEAEDGPPEQDETDERDRLIAEMIALFKTRDAPN